MSLPMLAVGWVSITVGSCAYQKLWPVVMLLTISGGTSSILLMQ